MKETPRTTQIQRLQLHKGPSRFTRRGSAVRSRHRPSRPVALVREATHERLRLVGTPMAPDVPIGAVLSGYRIERDVGRGATGVVYLARVVHLDRAVGLKMLPPLLWRDAR